MGSWVQTMVDRIFIEREVREHERTNAITARFSKAEIIACERFGEVFNPKSQNFRLQKSNPALILASKHAGHVLPAPPGYGLVGDSGFYFSHMLNCPYDCRYCFLQGMYRSANYVVFVNYEDFLSAIDTAINESEEPVWFNSGYDCDSLAFDPVTGFVDFFVPAFSQRPHGKLELRTKSTQIRSLLRHQPTENVIVAFSFSPQYINTRLEHGVAPVHKRIEAARRLQEAGWTVAIRFEPLVYFDGYEPHYSQLIETVLSELNSDRLHSVSIGSFRMPDAFFAQARSLYPQEPLFVQAIQSDDGITGYAGDIEQVLSEFCRNHVLAHVDDQRFYQCSEAGA